MASLAAAAPSAAQRRGDLRIPRITDLSECERGASDGDVTVCGRRRAPDRYRIPPELREDRTNPVNPSWAARARDERETGRYEGQAVGPGGALRQSLETECRWRAERQQLAGHPPDCTRRVRSPGD
jgi:hypothetical protein